MSTRSCSSVTPVVGCVLNRPPCLSMMSLTSRIPRMTMVDALLFASMLINLSLVYLALVIFRRSRQEIMERLRSPERCVSCGDVAPVHLCVRCLDARPREGDAPPPRCQVCKAQDGDVSCCVNCFDTRPRGEGPKPCGVCRGRGESSDVLFATSCAFCEGTGRQPE